MKILKNILVSSLIVGPGIGYGKLWVFHVVSLFFLLFYSLKIINSLQFKKLINESIYFQTLIAIFFWYSLSVIWSINLLYSIQYILYIILGLWVVVIIVYFAYGSHNYYVIFNIMKWSFVVSIVLGLFEVFDIFRLPTSPYSEYSYLFGRDAADFTELNSEVEYLLKTTPTVFWGNPNNYATALAMIFPYFFMLNKKIFAYLGCLVILFLIIMTGSRGNLIALSFGLFVFYAINLRRFSFLIILSFVALISLDSMMDILMNSDNPYVSEVAGIGYELLRYLFESSDGQDSIDVRQQLIRNGIDAFMASHGLGVGAGGSVAVQELFGGVMGGITSMHNFWIEILVDVGVVGATLFLSFYLSLILRLFIIHRKGKNSFYKYHSGALFMSMCIFAVGCISASSVIYFLPMWCMFGLSVVLILNHSNFESENINKKYKIN